MVVIGAGCCLRFLNCSSASRCHHLLKTFWNGASGWRRPTPARRSGTPDAHCGESPRRRNSDSSACRFHRSHIGYPISEVVTMTRRIAYGFTPTAGANHRPDRSGQSAGKTVEVGVGDYRCERGSRHGSTWCDLRRRQFRRTRTSRRPDRSAGDRADDHDNDTSARTGDQRGEPDRDRDHAIGLRTGSRTVVAVAQGWALSGHLCDEPRASCDS